MEVLRKPISTLFKLLFVFVMVLVLFFIKVNVAPKSKSMKMVHNITVSNPDITYSPTEGCSPGIPCVYPEVVDLRIIVIVYNRANSLLTILNSLNALETDGSKVALEVWLDRGRNGQESKETFDAATSFNFLHGKKRVHVQKQHVGIYGQWIDTWRPQKNSTEVALILEDDLTVSPFVWRYLRKVHALYGHLEDCGGYTLQCENVNRAHVNAEELPINVSPTQVTYMYLLIGTWGFMPHPRHWIKFQDWYHKMIKDPTFRPYVPDIRMTEWYQGFERAGTQDSMWEMWYIYYTTMHNLYTVYPNANGVFNNGGNCLAINRQEAGLHYKHTHSIWDNFKISSLDAKLLKKWPDEGYSFPPAKQIIRLSYSGASEIASSTAYLCFLLLGSQLLFWY